MSFDQIKSLTGLARRTTNWKDLRPRSPKALGDMSGILLSRIGAPTAAGVQDFDFEVVEKLNVCNDMAWTCIELISSTVGLGKLKARINDGKTITYVPDHPLQKLLDFPNASMTQFDWLQSYATHQRLYGTVANLLLRETMVDTCPVCASETDKECFHKLYYFNTGPIVQMMPLHPGNLIQEVYNVDGKPKKIFFYVPEAGRKFPIHPNNIMTDPFYNPSIGWYGISPTFLLKRWLDLDASMTNQMKQLFDNGSIPSMIINLKPGNNYTYEQEPQTLMQQMKEKWLAQFSSKGEGAKTPAFMYGDVSVERLQDKIEESISKGIYYEIQNRVCATYGVPPTLYEMGLRYGSQRSSAEQGEKDFYNRTISKILARIESKVNKLIVPSFETLGLEVTWDLSNMGIAAFLIQEQKSAVKKDWELGLISRDTARVLLGYDPVGGELGDDFYRLTVMSDGANTSQAAGMDNRLKTPSSDGTAGHVVNK
jgi:phage portal protein BeeE